MGISYYGTSARGCPQARYVMSEVLVIYLIVASIVTMSIEDDEPPKTTWDYTSTALLGLIWIALFLFATVEEAMDGWDFGFEEDA